MRFVFFCILGLIFIIPQISFSFEIGSGRLVLDFFVVFILYAAFHFNAPVGAAGSAVLAYCLEALSVVPHGLLIFAAVILFLAAFLLRDAVYAESYLTRSLWVFVFSLAWQVLFFSIRGLSVGPVSFFLQPALNGALAFPIFIFLDFLFEKILGFFGRKPPPLTGADLYQVKSDQRKYF